MSPPDSEIQDYCDWCSTSIRYGNAQVTVNQHVEQMDFDSDRAVPTVTVIRSDSLLMLCAPCGNRLDSRSLQDLLRAALPRR